MIWEFQNDDLGGQHDVQMTHKGMSSSATASMPPTSRTPPSNGIRIRIPDVWTGKPPRFGRLPEAGGLVSRPVPVSGGHPVLPLAP